MGKEITPYDDSELSKKEQVTQMFDTISQQYDQLNRVISLGIDQQWRRNLIARVKNEQPNRILDLATGTGDLAIMLAQETKAHITGLDISSGMLDIAQKKIIDKQLSEKVTMILADSENIPFESASFDAVTVAFGVRNFEHLSQGLSEIHRVLKTGGKLLVLETSVPDKFPFKQGYNLYTHYLMPLIGKVFSKDKKAYGYLSESAKHFPCGKKFCKILKANNFKQAQYFPQSMGVATIYQATK